MSDPVSALVQRLHHGHECEIQLDARIRALESQLDAVRLARRQWHDKTNLLYQCMGARPIAQTINHAAWASLLHHDARNAQRNAQRQHHASPRVPQRKQKK